MSKANDALHLPIPNHGCLTQQSKTVLLSDRQFLHSLTVHTGATPTASSIISVPLAQTGEGIKECELTEWHVEVHAQTPSQLFL